MKLYIVYNKGPQVDGMLVGIDDWMSLSVLRRCIACSAGLGFFFFQCRASETLQAQAQ